MWTSSTVDSGSRGSKASLSTEQPLLGDELRALKRYLTARGDQLTRFSVNYRVRTAAARAGLSIAVHPHMLRHGCGHALANRGYDSRASSKTTWDIEIRGTRRATRAPRQVASRDCGPRDQGARSWPLPKL